MKKSHDIGKLYTLKTLYKRLNFPFIYANITKKKTKRNSSKNTRKNATFFSI